MARYIDADTLGVGHCSEKVLPHDYCVAWNSLVDLINDTPTADVVEVRRGEWIETEHGWVCSRCDSFIDGVYGDKPKNHPFCTLCGADMRGERKE